MDRPTGNIPYTESERILADEDVQAAVPVGLGDTFPGFHIVGTEAKLFDVTWEDITGDPRQPFQFESGEAFAAPMQAVVGSIVAQQTGLAVGDQFVGAHGFVQMAEETLAAAGMHSHAHDPFTVVGVLKPSGSPADRAIFVSLDSVWNMHGAEQFEEYYTPEALAAMGTGHGDGDDDHDHEHADDHDHDTHADKMVTAVLVQLHTPALRFTFRQKVNDFYNAMAIIPIEEIAKLYDQLLGTAKTILLAIGYLVVTISGLSIVIGLYLSILQRKRDLAIMRALGASRGEIFGAVLIEAFWVAVLGIGSGWILGGLVTAGLGQYLSAEFGMRIGAFTLTREHISAFAVVGIVGILAGISPALQAYRSNIARDLAQV
ncbi:MAG: ABC transporter permease [Candidatus Hydrogenedentes bacterium]|nr:ABC transporter permease [Candidatus Hydrogenedentota bacterium]